MFDPYEPIPPRVPGLCDEPSCCGPIPESRRSRRRGGAIPRFCSEGCYKKNHARALKRGARLIDSALAWRTYPRSHTRGAKNPPNPYFGEMTALLDEFALADREMRKAAQRQRLHGVGATITYERAAG